MLFGRLWTQCQECQGSLHQDVLCTRFAAFPSIQRLLITTFQPHELNASVHKLKTSSSCATAGIALFSTVDGRHRRIWPKLGCSWIDGTSEPFEVSWELPTFPDILRKHCSMACGCQIIRPHRDASQDELRQTREGLLA